LQIEEEVMDGTDKYSLVERYKEGGRERGQSLLKHIGSIAANKKSTLKNNNF
jgi:hypothetical protein